MKQVRILLSLFLLFYMCICYTNFTEIEICSLYKEYPLNYGKYGEQGIPSTSSYPGARYFIQGIYNKSTNTLWEFGGIGHSDETSGKKWKNPLTL